MKIEYFVYAILTAIIINGIYNWYVHLKTIKGFTCEECGTSVIIAKEIIGDGIECLGCGAILGEEDDE